MATTPSNSKSNCKRILFVDYGTRDDISPTLAIALAAHDEGHDVAFVTNQEHQELVSTYGVKFNDGCAVAWGDLYAKEADAMLAGSSLNMFSEMVSSYLGHWHATELRTLNCIKRGFDLVVGTQWTSVIATGVARRLKIPVVLLQGAPLTPTKAWPCIYMGQGQGMFGFTNTLSFDMASKLWWRLKGPTYVTWQVKRVGVQAVEDPNLALPFAHDRNIPVVVTAHPALLPRPADWERWIHVCGPAILPPPTNWQPSDELDEFITRGLPPVYISFGSCLAADVEALTALAIDAAQAAGLRAIIDTTFEGVFASPRRMPQGKEQRRVCQAVVSTSIGAVTKESDNICFVQNLPLTSMLPRCSVFVHTACTHQTGCALWAGIPSVCVPFIFDSRFWADRLFAIGAAARPLPIENLTAPGLAAAIKDVASSSSIKKAAESLKQGLVDHNGAGACANLLRRIMQRPWDRTVMEVLPRRKGDLWIHVSSFFFKTWERRHAVIDDHSLRLYEYLPIGTPETKHGAIYYLENCSVVPYSTDVRPCCFTLKMRNGVELSLSAESERSRVAWIQSFVEVAASWEIDNTPDAAAGWSDSFSQKIKDAQLENGGRVTALPSTSGSDVDDILGSE